MTSQHAKEERAGIGRELQTVLCQKGTVQVASEQAPRSGGTTASPLGYSRSGSWEIVYCVDMSVSPTKHRLYAGAYEGMVHHG